jgi:dienelactone hydrolase
MHTSNYPYHHDSLELQGFLAYEKTIDQPKPAILIAHDWSGRNDFACDKAKKLAALGYVGFALDMYGQGRTAEAVEDKMALMNPIMEDRKLLSERMRAAFDAVSALPEVDKEKVAVIGFCFGGLCALDLARSGAKVRAVVSFHGLLAKPENIPNKKIYAKILALHGYDDPMVRPEQVNDFCQEMTEANVDWQVYQYGHTQHAFTNPKANDYKLGTVYDAKADKRSWIAMYNFLEEVFQS